MARIFTKKLPSKLDKSTKDLITKSYLDAIKSIENDEFEYIKSKISRKLSITKNASISWVAELSQNYRQLYNALLDYQKGKIKLSKKSYKAIGAALFYFINPFDIIPDYTPGIGYLDDFCVLATCISIFSKRDKEIIKNYLVILPEDQCD